MTAALTTLAQDVWQARAEAHQNRVNRYAVPYLARRSSNKKHPVEDFLFTYYTQKPGQLSRWHHTRRRHLGERGTQPKSRRRTG